MGEPVSDERLSELEVIVRRSDIDFSSRVDLYAALSELQSLRAQCARVQRDAEQLREYASRLEDHFVALAGVISNAEEDRARKEIAAERAVCFAAMAAKEAG